MKIIKCLLVSLLFSILTLTVSCKAKDPFKRIKVGMTPDEVEEIMGKPDGIDSDGNNNYYVYYYFSNASSIEDAQKKTNKGIAVKYQAIIFQSQDRLNFTIYDKKDIFSGIWGVS